jgi:hypothetical protein
MLDEYIKFISGFLFGGFLFPLCTILIIPFGFLFLFGEDKKDFVGRAISLFYICLLFGFIFFLIGTFVYIGKTLGSAVGFPQIGVFLSAIILGLIVWNFPYEKRKNK